MQNKYQKLKDLIETNNLTIKTQECYDPQSGWTGNNIYVYDGNTLVTDMSINGYCFRDDTIDDSIKKITGYLEEKNMNTFDKFKNWVYRHSIKIK